MSNDISTSYTKIKNQNEGRKGILIGKERKPSLHLKNTGFLNYIGRGRRLNETRRSDWNSRFIDGYI